MPDTSFHAVPTSFAELPGWAVDDHLAAIGAFRRSSARLIARERHAPSRSSAPAVAGLLDVFEAALAITSPSADTARAFFEANFVPHAVMHGGPAGMVTGYYEPHLEGSLTPDATFRVPLYRRPPDLVNLVDESERASEAEGLTHARMVDGRAVPYATRAEIEEGALRGQGLELVYLADPVDAFFAQVQGSAAVLLRGGGIVRLAYDGKNGYPYTSIGRYLVEIGVMTPAEMSLRSLSAWLRADPARAAAVMRRNRSFVFFRELTGADADAPQGLEGIPLTPGRSLAVDASFHPLGLPVWVAAPTLCHPPGCERGFGRLMVAQDAGSAIRGPERGDIYFGSGDRAGELAGVTKHACNFVVLLPRVAAMADMPSLGPVAP